MSVRRARPSFVPFGVTLLLTPVLLLVACARRVPRPRSGPVDAGDGPAGTAVPDLIGRNVALVDQLAGAAGLVAVLSYRPRARQAPGTVVAVHPRPGAVVGRGSTVQVSVAGRPGADLGARIAADRRRFVGLGADPDGTLVVAVAAGVDPAVAVSAIRPALAGRRHRVVTGRTTFAELERVRAGVSAELLGACGFTVRVDPVAGEVRVDGEVPAAVAAALSDRYGRAVVVAREEADATGGEPRPAPSGRIPARTRRARVSS
ncbi:hypothetical protein GCM10020358_00110 [Amorphoplanes nipponensis]|uniref:PASTA domain-containing protein n=1 Tax=Actinoplanes nipponensis TaxID=135950 RepID=A0A919JKR1_9ACTN|nr:PASTA domain-containing protein [Actinoplanes nipponensis]GIE51458.1 hypothetical protein Ani05nite_49920 [Actinoplanes nipponensis]